MEVSPSERVTPLAALRWSYELPATLGRLGKHAAIGHQQLKYGANLQKQAARAAQRLVETIEHRKLGPTFCQSQQRGQPSEGSAR